jgi:uncharacterized repeat protein (TIGR01451 family)
MNRKLRALVALLLALSLVGLRSGPPVPGANAPIANADTNSIGANTALSADLQVTKTANQSTIKPGSTATFKIAVTNLGPSSAPVVLTDPLPDNGISWNTPTTGCKITGLTNNQALDCSNALAQNLGPGHQFIAQVNGNVPQSYCNQSSQITNTASVAIAATANPPVVDPNPSNNSSTAGIVVNCPLSANPDSYSTPQNTNLTATAPGVLANDTYPSSDAVQAVLDATTAKGTLTFNPDGSFTYTPATNFCGQDTFSYHLADATNGTNSNSAADTIQVTCPSPVASPDTYAVDEGSTLSVAAPGVLQNDTPSNPGDALQALIQSGPASGTFTPDGNSDGGFSYTPSSGF